MKFNSAFILTVILLLLTSVLYTQTPSYYHYTSSKGLASSTVYEIIQDKDGFMWFATANGLSKFDGKHFTSFRSIDGLNSNSIISIVEGENGELYIGNFEKGINVLKNGKIENYCSEINGKSFVISYLMLVPPENNEKNIMAYSRGTSLNLISEKKSGRLINKVFYLPHLFLNKIELLPNGDVIALTTTGIFNFKHGVFSKLQISGLPDTAVYCFEEGEDGCYYIGTKGMIYKIKNNTVIDSYKIDITSTNEVIKILRDRNNNIWFSIMNKGFFFIPKGTNNIIDLGSKMGLENTLVNNYFEDNEGNIWLSTFGKGVYCLNNLYLQTYNENDGLSNNNIYSIAKDSTDKLLLGTFNGISVLENGRFNLIKTNFNKILTEYIYSIKNINNEFYVCSTLSSNEMEHISYQGMKLYIFAVLSFCKLGNGLYLFGARENSLNIYKELNFNNHRPSPFYVFGDSSIPNRINEIFEDSEKNVWIGTGLGLCKVVNITDNSTEWKKSFFLTNPVLNSRINAITQDNKNNIWFAGEKGIAYYNLKNDSVKTFTNINGYDLSSSTSITIDNQNRIWIGNMKGLFLLDGKLIKQLNSQSGLPSDEVLSLFYDLKKNQMCIGTSNGISFLDINLYDSYSPKPLDVKLISIKAGDSVYSRYNNLVFNHNQNHVYIDYNAICFSSPGSVRYKYNLNGIWIETDNNFIDLVSLKSGTYKLQIMAKSQDSDWSKPYFLSFQVLPRFIETVWFTLLILLTLGCISILGMFWRLKTNTKKARYELELTERINELKHQALSAMMNPHFIANSLNSVQYLVNSRKYKEANDYIAMMAKLMRKNLDTAGKAFIQLSEEITRLKLYLDIEKLRFQESFTYEIKKGTDIDPDTVLIPNMIIQPFVENSLWHGIINSGKRGLLTISFNFEDVDIDSVIFKSLIIKVTDNGIGIQEAKKHKKEDHISKGIQIIEERLKLLSTKMHLPQPIVFEDLSSQDDNMHGTEVIISLPPPLYKIINPE